MTAGRVAVAALLVVAAVAIAYANAWPAAFQFDDFRVIVDAASVHDWASWWASMPGIRPLLKASYVLSWRAGGGAPGAFVACNVAIHATNALLVLALARRWIAALVPTLAPAPRDAAACAVALLFALHPAQTEAVTYISGRSTSLAALFYLASMLAFERWRDDRSGAWRWISLASFAAALAVKETAATLPFALALVEWSRGTRPRAIVAAIRPHLALLVLALVAMLALPTYRHLLDESLSLRDPLANLVAQGRAIAWLVTHPLLTLRLSIDPDLAHFDAGVPDAWLALALALAGLAALALARRRSVVGFGVAWFLLHLAPTNSLVARYDLVNDRQLYLPIVGVALIAAVALVARLRPAFAAVALATLAVVLAGGTIGRNADYASEIALWEATARASPAKARVWNNLGYAYQQAGDRERAGVAYRRALALDPEDYKARNNLDALER